MSFKFPYKLLLVNYHGNQHVNVKQPLPKPPTNTAAVWTELWQNARDGTNPEQLGHRGGCTDRSKEMLCLTALAANTFYINITKAVKSPCISTQTYHR